MITVKQKGDFSKFTGYLERLKGTVHLSNLDKYGREGVAALSAATPVRTGETASSWYYTIENDGKKTTISFNNSHIEDGWCPIAIILQYGHATRNGGWVEGVDYINPALKPIFDSILDNAWKEVKNL